jgi:hypothetical protein
MPRYIISQSVIRDNEGSSSPEGAILYVQTGFTDETIGAALTTGISGLRNTTIFHNKGGFIANIREGMILNNITMIKNAAGLYLQAPQWTSTTTNGTTTTTKNIQVHIFLIVLLLIIMTKIAPQLAVMNL